MPAELPNRGVPTCYFYFQSCLFYPFTLLLCYIEINLHLNFQLSLQVNILIKNLFGLLDDGHLLRKINTLKPEDLLTY